MKKLLSYTLSVLMILSLLLIPNYDVQAANVSLGVSASKVNIGDTVKVTVTVPDGITATVDLTGWSNILSFSSSSVEVGTNGGTITVNLGKMSMANSNSVTVTFKANTSGKANVKATIVSAVDNNTVEDVVIGGATTTIEVKNKTVDSGNNNGGTTTPQLSADNSLSILKLSDATLSPTFKKSTTKYTATVAYDVTKVVVSAKTSNSKAVIESVTNNGTVNLKVGENTIKIVVRAENGVKATYTIVVTRKEKETTPVTPPEGDNPPSSEVVPPTSEIAPPEVNEMLKWDGEQLYPVDTIPTESIPADFESTLLVVNGQQMQGLSYTKADLKVLYLNNTNKAGALYVYDEAQQTIYPYIKLISEKGYVIVLLPDEQNEPAPQDFESCTFSIEGKGRISAYQVNEELDFYLIYCMNATGQKGWYMYDSVEGTYQRYLEITPSVQTQSPVADVVPDDDLGDNSTGLEQVLNIPRMAQYIILAIAVALLLILIIVIIVLAVKLRKKNENYVTEKKEDAEDAIIKQEIQEIIAINEFLISDKIDEMLEKKPKQEEFEDVFETPVKEPPVVEVPVEEPPVVEVPVEDPPVVEAPVEEPLVEEVPEEEPVIRIIRKPKTTNLTSKLSSTKEADDDDLEFIDFE